MHWDRYSDTSFSSTGGMVNLGDLINEERWKSQFFLQKWFPRHASHPLTWLVSSEDGKKLLDLMKNDEIKRMLPLLVEAMPDCADFSKFVSWAEYLQLKAGWNEVFSDAGITNERSIVRSKSSAIYLYKEGTRRDYSIFNSIYSDKNALVLRLEERSDTNNTKDPEVYLLEGYIYIGIPRVSSCQRIRIEISMDGILRGERSFELFEKFARIVGCENNKYSVW